MTSELKPKILFFSHEYCRYCPQVEKMLQDLGLEYKKMDLKADPDACRMAEGFGIRMVPSIVIVYNGSTKIFMGYSESLRQKIQQFLNEVVS
ncbi:MAG: glutaredoxin domain-containing protein [Nitrososphaeria archaeon]